MTELEQPLWRIARHTAIYPKDKRLPDEVVLARQDFQDMAAVMEAHMSGRQFLVGDRVTVADFVAAYTLDWANEVHLLDASPQLRGYMDRMYARPTAPPRLVQGAERVGIGLARLRVGCIGGRKGERVAGDAILPIVGERRHTSGQSSGRASLSPRIAPTTPTSLPGTFGNDGRTRQNARLHLRETSPRRR